MNQMEKNMTINKLINIYFLLMILGLSFLCGCAQTEGSIKNGKLLGIFSSEGTSYYAYYIFSEDGNKQRTCEWKAFLSQNGQTYRSTALYEYELEKIDNNLYYLHLKNSENNGEYEAIYSISDDTIVDETGTYDKQQAINEKAKIEVLLQGTWNAEVSESVNAIYSFKEGYVSCQTEVLGVSLEANEGEYKIGENIITINYDSGVNAELGFTYENSSLKVYFDGAVMTKE